MHWHHSSPAQTRTTGGFLSPNTRAVRTTHRHGHGHHHHGVLGTSGVTTTKTRSPGTGLFRRRARTPRTKVRTTRTTPRTGLFGRRRHAAGHHHHHRTTAVPVTATTVRRKPTMGDRINGALMKIKGSLRGHPREKAMGDRLMHGERRRLRR